MAFVDERISELERERDLLIRGYGKCRHQARETLNQGDLPRLEQQAERLKREYEGINQEIERLRTGALPPLTPDLMSRLTAELRADWEADLHCLDYRKQEHRMNRLICVEKQDAVLLLIQDGVRMKADLCIERIRRRVLDQGRLRRFSEDFSQERRIDPDRFIACWCDKLQIQAAAPGLETGTRQVIQALQQSVTHGQTLYLELRLEEVGVDFLVWFLEAVWRPLADAVVNPSRGIGLFVVLTTENDLPRKCMSPQWCSRGQGFECEKYLEIRLQKWPESDIQDWMIKYLNDSLARRSLPLQDAPALASRVYRYSHRGIPLEAHNYILGDLLTRVVGQIPGQLHAAS